MWWGTCGVGGVLRLRMDKTGQGKAKGPARHQGKRSHAEGRGTRLKGKLN